MKSPLDLAVEALEPFWRASGNFQGAYEDDPVCDGLVVADIRNAATALAELKAVPLISPTDDVVVRKVAAAIGGTEAKNGGSVGGRLWDVDLINSARAAISAYVTAMGGKQCP